MSTTYKRAGVDIDAGDRFVEAIRPFVRMTRRSGVIDDIGGFAGLFHVDFAKYQQPLLVASTDGVGTKVRLAHELTCYDTIGIDLVAMCVNDVACSGAEPLFFLDYLATGKLDPDIHSVIVKGIAEACQRTRCALIGGETAEMPGIYDALSFDLAGFVVGIVDRGDLIDGSSIRAGDAVIGIASSGFHSNGYSLINRIVEDRRLPLDRPLEGDDQPLGQRLLTPTKLYSPLVQSLMKAFTLKGVAHITGGGLTENVPRILPHGANATIRTASWPWPPLMRLFQSWAKIGDDEMLRVFNCGIGLVLVVDQACVDELIARVAGLGEVGYQIGTIEASHASGHQVRFVE